MGVGYTQHYSLFDRTPFYFGDTITLNRNFTWIPFWWDAIKQQSDGPYLGDSGIIAECSVGVQPTLLGIHVDSRPTLWGINLRRRRRHLLERMRPLIKTTLNFLRSYVSSRRWRVLIYSIPLFIYKGYERIIHNLYCGNLRMCVPMPGHNFRRGGRNFWRRVRWQTYRFYERNKVWTFSRKLICFS